MAETDSVAPTVPDTGLKANSSEIEIREANSDDRPAVLALLTRTLGWHDDPRHEALFAWKHEQNPFGPSPMWVACDGGRVVALRVFMRWQFRRGSETLRAVRAVDTATDPAYQGKGLFTALTLHGLEALRADGVDFVFNTPNAQSLPGYLKMGWQVVGKVPAAFRLRGPRSLVTTAKARVPAELWSLPLDVGVPFSDWLAHSETGDAAPDHDPLVIVTDRSDAFLAWRYGTPLLGYRAVAGDGGALVLRGRQRGAARELVLSDSVGLPKSRVDRSVDGCALCVRLRPRAARWSGQSATRVRPPARRTRTHLPVAEPCHDAAAWKLAADDGRRRALLMTVLRFGVMVRSTRLRRWQADVLDRLAEVPGVELSLVVLDGRADLPRTLPERLRRITRSKNAVWNLYNNAWVGRRAEHLRTVDLTNRFATVPSVTSVVEKRGYSEYFPDPVVDQIVSYELDFLLRFGFGIIRGQILDAARHGVWSFHHGDDDGYRGGPPAFWEIVDGSPVSGAMLQRLTDRLDGGVVIRRGWFATAAHSYVRNTERVHLGSVDWPAQAARELIGSGSVKMAPSTSDTPIRRPPGNSDTAIFLLRQSVRFLRAQLRGLVRSDDWDVAIADDAMSDLVEGKTLTGIRWLGLRESKVAYAADPFAIDMPDGPAILYERFDRARRVGEIWIRELTDSRSRPADMPIDRHASYPYVVRTGDRTYCAPQVAVPGGPLFELDHGRWTNVADLVPGEQLLDPTLVEWDGRWWLFGTKPGDLSNVDLYIWLADQLDGPWRPHRANPVKSDVRSARPAGTPFEHEGALFRPSQDCSAGYGAAVSLCRVDRLTLDEYEETVVKTIRPDPAWPFPDGMHTLCSTESGVMFDARRTVFDHHQFVAELRARLALLAGRAKRRTNE